MTEPVAAADLDALERLAQAAEGRKRTDSLSWDFSDGISPSVVLDLIARLRRAEEALTPLRLQMALDRIDGGSHHAAYWDRRRDPAGVLLTNAGLAVALSQELRAALSGDAQPPREPQP